MIAVGKGSYNFRDDMRRGFEFEMTMKTVPIRNDEFCIIIRFCEDSTKSRH